MAEAYLYWVSTALLALLYLTSATMYVIKKDWVRESILALGYPAYLRPVLIAVKVLAVALLLSRASVALSDLAYAGMFFHLSLAALAHIGVRKPSDALPAAVGLILLATSFATQNAARPTLSPHGPAAVAHQLTTSSRS